MIEEASWCRKFVLNEEEESIMPGEEVVVIFNRSQYSDLTRRAGNAERLLRETLVQTGLEGEVRVSLIRQRAGSTHTQGIRLSRYDLSGVVLTVQPGGNDSRVEMNVHPPQGIDAPSLYKRLKEVLENKEESEDVVGNEAQAEQAAETPAEEGTVKTSEFEETGTTASEERETVVEGDNPQFEIISLEEAQRITSSASDTDTSLAGFVRDREKVQLYLLEVESLLKETEQKTLTSRQMSDAFRRLLGESTNTSPLGPILKRLCDRGDLVRTGARGKGYRYSLPKALVSDPSPLASLRGFAEDEIERIRREEGVTPAVRGSGLGRSFVMPPVADFVRIRGKYPRKTVIQVFGISNPTLVKWDRAAKEHQANQQGSQPPEQEPAFGQAPTDIKSALLGLFFSLRRKRFCDIKKGNGRNRYTRYKSREWS